MLISIIISIYEELELLIALGQDITSS